MANRKSIRDYNKRQTYIYESTARDFELAPEKQPIAEPEKKKKVSRSTKHNRERALQMNLGYVTFLTVAAVATVFVCIQYLKLQSEITSRNKNVIALETELANLKGENDAVYESIVDSIDLEHIKHVAIYELGMVYANQEQIIKYESKDDDFARQYEDVPKDGYIE